SSSILLGCITGGPLAAILAWTMSRCRQYDRRHAGQLSSSPGCVEDIMADVTTKTAIPVEMTVFPIIFAVSFCHMLNDIMQSMLSAIYPMLKADYHLDF